MRRTLTLLLGLCAGAAPAAPAADPHPEQLLIAAMDELRAGRTEVARDKLGELVERQPNFRLARLIQRELQLARFDGRGPFGFRNLQEPDASDLAEEARLRLERERPPPDALPDAVLQLAPATRNAVVVDLLGARLYLLEKHGSRLALARDYYAAMGKNGTGKTATGDQRTPVGIYHITGFIPDRELPELYGMGAFPVNYPNTWDRQLGRTGSGIWLHGVPRDTYARPPRSSDGCVTLANDDLRALKGSLAKQTPVVFAEAVRWRPAADLERERGEFMAAIENWRKRWSAVDTDGYLSFYADDFVADGMDRKAFVAHKRRVNANKRFIRVDLRDVALFRYPGDGDLRLAQFTQDYRSDNYARTSYKEQFWRRGDDGRWSIVREHSR